MATRASERTVERDRQEKEKKSNVLKEERDEVVCKRESFVFSRLWS